MVLRYLYAALSAFIPLWSIFNHSALVNWTRSISSTIFPRLLLKSPDEIPSLDPVESIVPDIAYSINSSLSLSCVDQPELDAFHHPLLEKAQQFSSSLILVSQSPTTYLYIILLGAVTAIFLCLCHLRRCLSSEQPRKDGLLPPIHKVPLAVTLAVIENLGHAASEETSRQDTDGELESLPSTTELASSSSSQSGLPLVADDQAFPEGPQCNRDGSPDQSSCCASLPPTTQESHQVSQSAPSGVSHPETHTTSLQAPPIPSASAPTPSSPSHDDILQSPSVGATTSPYVSFPPSPCAPSDPPSVSLDCSTIDEQTEEDASVGDVERDGMSTDKISQDREGERGDGKSTLDCRGTSIQDLRPESNSVRLGDEKRAPEASLAGNRVACAEGRGVPGAAGGEEQGSQTQTQNDSSSEHVSVLFSCETEDSVCLHFKTHDANVEDGRSEEAAQKTQAQVHVETETDMAIEERQSGDDKNEHKAEYAIGRDKGEDVEKLTRLPNAYSSSGSGSGSVSGPGSATASGSSSGSGSADFSKDDKDVSEVNPNLASSSRSVPVNAPEPLVHPLLSSCGNIAAQEVLSLEASPNEKIEADTRIRGNTNGNEEKKVASGDSEYGDLSLRAKEGPSDVGRGDAVVVIPFEAEWAGDEDVQLDNGSKKKDVNEHKHENKSVDEDDLKSNSNFDSDSVARSGTAFATGTGAETGTRTNISICGDLTHRSGDSKSSTVGGSSIGESPPCVLALVKTPSRNERDRETETPSPEPELKTPGLEMVDPAFPLMQADPAVKSVLKEEVNDVEWTLVNLKLNEEGKFVCGPKRSVAIESPLKPQDVRPAALASQGKVDSQQPQRQEQSDGSTRSMKNSRSDTVLLDHRLPSDLFGHRPRFSEGKHLSPDVRSLVSRLGLILPERNFRFYEPLAELKYAIQRERAALSLASVPRTGMGERRRRVVRTMSCSFGLSREEFLGEGPLPAHPPGWSYADVARRNLSSTPSSRSVSSPLVGYSVPPSPNPEQGEQHVWSINKCRGGQGAAMVVLGQVEAEREKVRKMGMKREWPRARGRSASVSSPSPAGSVRAPARRSSVSGLKMLFEKNAESAGSPAMPRTPVGSSASPSGSQSSSPGSPATIGKMTFMRNAPESASSAFASCSPRSSSPLSCSPSESKADSSSNWRKPWGSGPGLTSNPATRSRSGSVSGISGLKTSAPQQVQRRQRSFSVSNTGLSLPPPTSTTSVSTTSASGNTASVVVKKPRMSRRASEGMGALETIVGSPPDSPPSVSSARGAGGETSVIGGISLDGVVRRAIAGIRGEGKGKSPLVSPAKGSVVLPSTPAKEAGVGREEKMPTPTKSPALVALANVALSSSPASPSVLSRARTRTRTGSISHTSTTVGVTTNATTTTQPVDTKKYARIDDDDAADFKDEEIEGGKGKGDAVKSVEARKVELCVAGLKLRVGGGLDESQWAHSTSNSTSNPDSSSAPNPTSAANVIVGPSSSLAASMHAPSSAVAVVERKKISLTRSRSRFS